VRRVALLEKRVALLENRVALLDNSVAVFALDAKKPRIKWLSIWMIRLGVVRAKLALALANCAVYKFHKLVIIHKK